MIAPTLMASTQLLAELTQYTTLSWPMYIVIGGVAGWLASKFMGTDEQQGIVLNVLIGVIGGVLGGFLLSLLHLKGAGGLVSTLVSALVGSVILIWLWKRIKK